MFLDPPYSYAERAANLYATDSGSVAAKAREWALEAGKRPDMRIALCCYEGEHAMPDDWTTHQWKTQGGYGNQGNGRGKENAAREMVWFSPACLNARQPALL